MEDQPDSLAQVRFQFTTKDQTVKLPDGIGAILVSSGFKRYALSTLINNLLESDTPIPFEFLINGKFLRTSIDDFLTANGISSEVALAVEYVRASVPPTYSTSFEHDDWISAVDVLSSTSPAAIWAGKNEPVPQGEGRILSAGYDGVLRIWSTSSELLAISNPALDSTVPQAIKAAKFLTPSKIVTGGNDRFIRLWSFKNNPTKLDPTLELVGHKSSVDCIAVHAPSARILSASTDHTVCLWSSRASDAPAAPEALLSPKSSNKRRKPNAKAESITQKGPLAILDAHTRPVSQAIFDANDRTVGYSCSWDQSLVTWDLTTSNVVSTRRTMHPLLSLVHLPELNLLGAGTSARHISMLDTRAHAKDVTGLTLRGHTGPVVSLASEPGKPWGLISASFDGTCRVWDLRSVRLDNSASKLAVGGTSQVCDSLYVIRREGSDSKDGNKLFSVCWDQEVGIVSGGEDKTVQINQTASGT
jgi:ribosome biogenesis protein YTM1